MTTEQVLNEVLAIIKEEQSQDIMASEGGGYVFTRLINRIEELKQQIK